MSDLFRREAVQHSTRRLEGTVILATPLSVKLIGFFLAFVIIAAAGFATQASYARKATVPGFLVPDQGLIRLRSQVSGTLRTVLVHEGDTVAAGDHVAVVDLSAETAGGNVGLTLSKGMDSEGEASRAKAESTLASLEVERDQSKIRLTKGQAELKEAQTQVSLQAQRVELAQTDLKRATDMAAKGFLPRREVDTRRLAELATEQDLAGQRRQQAGIERDIADIQARLAAIPIEIGAARAAEQAAAAALNQRRAESEARRLQFLVAPIAGRIAALPVATGEPVVAGGLVAVIVPSGGRLEAELLAPSRSIGFVQPGQGVALSLQAFPYQRFGTVKGIVRTVSSTVLAPAEVGFQGLNLQEPVFRIRVSLAREDVEAYGQAIPMQPGMLVSAEIVFDRRSLLKWLFDPIYAVGGRA